LPLEIRKKFPNKINPRFLIGKFKDTTGQIRANVESSQALFWAFAVVKDKRERLSSFPFVAGTGFFSNWFLENLHQLSDINM